MTNGEDGLNSRLEEARRRAAAFGPAVRAMRRARSTSAVARMLGMSAKTLHRIEDGTQLPTYEQAVLLAEALGRPLEDISGPLHTNARPRARCVVAAAFGEWSLVDRDALVPAPIQLVLSVNAAEPGIRHDGVEWLYVVRGTVRLEFGFRREEVELGEHALYEFDAANPHAVVNVGDTAAVLLRGMTALGIKLHTGEYV